MIRLSAATGMVTLPAWADRTSSASAPIPTLLRTQPEQPASSASARIASSSAAVTITTRSPRCAASSSRAASTPVPSGSL
jgi:hypothetical protein